MVDLYDPNCYQIDHAANTDLLQMEKNFAALKSNFSGTSQPGNAEAGMDWYDTNASKKLRKTRNAANSAWLGLMQGDTSQIMLVYRNTAGEGWVVATGVTSDYVVATKNHGAGTYTTGGVGAGTWVISGTSVDSHVLSIAEMPAHTHGPGAGSNFVVDVGGTGGAGSGRGYTSATGSTGGGGGHTHGLSQAGTWRIQAIVCTLQYVAI